MRFSQLLHTIKEQSGSEPAQKAIQNIRQLSTHTREPSPNALPYERKRNIDQNTMARLISAAISARNARAQANKGQNLDIRA